MKNFRTIFRPTRTAAGREYPPPNEMWKQTKPRMRVMLGVAACSLLLVLAYMLRPINPITAFWREIGIQPSFVVLIMCLSALGGTPAYFWWRTQWSIFISMSGLIFFLALIGFQAATTESIALYVVVMGAGMVAQFGIWMLNATEDEAKEAVIKNLLAQNNALQVELDRISAERSSGITADDEA